MTLDENTDTTKARPLTGRCALVTGASRGIGRSIALELARQGASVAVNFLNSQDDAVAVAKDIDAMGSQVMLVKANVSIRDDVQAMVAEVQDKFGGLDTIVSNAAAGGFRDLNDLTPVNLEATLRNNSAPVVWLAQAAAESLAAEPHHGKVVAVSSHGSQWAVPHYGAIGASKAALESFVRHLALEFGDRGVNFNCVLPGIIPTDAIASMPGAESLVDAATERMMVGNRRLCEQDVASVVAFLCDGASDLIQGQTIVVDGGVSIRI
ncbi:Enoyl-[acyl-carrier-protein] reductase [NADPH] FabL [Rubripirellula obstinata]|uniref:Enoyl-[acyl-carrier-protein] reductase [NADPH] FabL n=1 Tax=Rubripirellula obstinata TaxID=406547 RepID=A0A5B1CIB3_9BACT|nr:SDR family oxidoreductase [Rubripirellula obstinata]KAA1259004.1 Enoyl-[acyl-carrier-protein] reductase [NADPH] FabL [Rubripirellula obstinata]